MIYHNNIYKVQFIPGLVSYIFYKQYKSFYENLNEMVAMGGEETVMHSLIPETICHGDMALSLSI